MKVSLYREMKSRFERHFLDGYREIDAQTILLDLYKERSSILAEISESSELIENISERSALHESGFNRFVIMSSESGKWRLRMNVWCEDVATRLSQSQSAHSHAWDHSSVVLSGRMNNLFFVATAGDEYIEYTTEKAGSAEMVASGVGRSAINTGRIIVVPAGATYSQQAAEIHRIVPDGKTMATFCLQSLSGLSTARMFSKAAWVGPRIDFPNWRDGDRFETEWQRSIAIATSDQAS